MSTAWHGPQRPTLPPIGERVSVLEPAVDGTQFIKGFLSTIAIYVLVSGAIWLIPVLFRWLIGVAA